jgi:stage V sporulation protein AC
LLLILQNIQKIYLILSRFADDCKCAYFSVKKENLRVNSEKNPGKEEARMEMTPKQYQEYVKRKAPDSPLLKDIALAFLIGGAICVLGQLITAGWGAAGLGKEDAGTATSISLVFLSALTTGLNVYNKLARFGGAGTLVPITGFANAVVSPAIDFKSEGFVTGMAAKMFLIAGPVIVFGTLASVLYGIVLMLFHLA